MAGTPPHRGTGPGDERPPAVEPGPTVEAGATAGPGSAEPGATSESGTAETGAATEPGSAVETGPTAEELAGQLADMEDQLRRALADLDNLRKRTAREVERQRAEERARVAAEWLPVLDHLDLALQHADADPASIVEGVRTIRDQAVAVLSRLGFPRQEQVGEPFDPKRHEAVATEPDPNAQESTVIRVVRPGYGGDEHQLRPAAVVVATRGIDAPDT